MKSKTFPAAVAAAVLAVAAASSASADVVVYSQTFNSNAFENPIIQLTEPGTYDFTFTSTRAVNLDYLLSYNTHYDVFRAPAPRPHEENLEGNQTSGYDYDAAFGTSYSTTFTYIEPEISYFDAGDEYLYLGVEPGTPLYSLFRYESATASFTVTPENADYFEFTVTAIRRDAVPVPEPGTWALMILGFGLMGGALRAHRGPLPA